jgi:hypothetical protein
MHAIINPPKLLDSDVDHLRDTRFIGDIGLDRRSTEALVPGRVFPTFFDG